MNLKDLLPSGIELTMHFMPWFGTSSHRDVGYDSTDPATIALQLQKMAALGFDGVNIDWYGNNQLHHNLASLRMLAECERQKKKFSICVDQGIIPEAIQTAATAGDTAAQAKVQAGYEWALAYVRDTFIISDAYHRWQGGAIVNFFGDGSFKFLDWKRLRGILPTAKFIFRQRGGFGHAESDGAFSWVPDSTPDPNDPGLPYLLDFYSAAAANPTKLAIGSIFCGFNNDNPKDPGWSVWDGGKHTKPSRRINRREGLTLLESLSVVPLPKAGVLPVPILMGCTWNDYEEGSQFEKDLGKIVEKFIA